MADSSKEICKWLERIADQARVQNKLLRQIADNMKSVSDNMGQKQFDAFDAPPYGTVYQNGKGCVMMNVADFDELVREIDEELES